MKQRMIVVFIACAAMLGSSPSILRAQVGVGISANVDIQINSTSDFYQPLESYGSWVDVGSYGRCWHPREIDTDWQPYTIGHWEWTDAGWYWVSDEPWGWACFHYGSWYDAPEVGWVWIPGTEWAPAWVTWRYSDDYIGWAPCGPGRSVLGPSFFTFCDVHRFQDHFRGRRDFQVNDTRIINRTRIVNNFNRQTVDIGGRERTIFANRGPGIDPIRRATGRDFTPRPIRDVMRESHAPENMRRDSNQPRELRQDQRNNEQPRRDNVPPTGREQQRNYQQPDNRQPRRDQTPPNNQPPEQQRRDRAQPQTPEQRPLAPTGRNDVRPTQPERRDATPARPPQDIPKATPPAEQRPLAPTGRNEVRPAAPEHRDITPARPQQEVPKPTPPAEQRREVPAPPQRSAVPSERPLAPTGREGAHAPTQAPAERPAMRPEQPAHPAVPPAPPRDGDGHRDGRDGQ